MILVLLDDDHESKGSSGLRTEIWEEEASKGGGSCNCASESERSERRTQGNGTPTTEASFLSLGSASAALAQISPSISTCLSFLYAQRFSHLGFRLRYARAGRQRGNWGAPFHGMALFTMPRNARKRSPNTLSHSYSDPTHGRLNAQPCSPRCQDCAYTLVAFLSCPCLSLDTFQQDSRRTCIFVTLSSLWRQGGEG